MSLEKAITLYKEGMLQKDIASLFNVDSSTVSYWIKKSGVQKGTQHLQNRGKHLDKSEEIIKLYNQGLGSHTIAKQLNITKSTVLDHLKRNNVDTRVNNADAHRKYTLDHNYFKNIDSENKAYVLGLLFADGSLAKDEWKISISLIDKDIKVLEFLQQEFKTDRPLNKIKRNHKNPNHQDASIFIFNSEDVWLDSQKWNLFPSKTFNTKFPLQIPAQFYKDFIRGYFDGDGYVSKSGYRIEITGTEELLLEIATQIHSATGFTYSLLRNRFPERNTNIRILNYWGKNKCKAIANYLYPNYELFGMERKKLKLLSFLTA